MKSSGKYLVLFLVGFSLLAAAGTFWNYSRAVFSTDHATVIDAAGNVEATFSPSITAKLHPHQQAKITLASFPSKPVRAEVVKVTKKAVFLQILESAALSPGEACDVTIDTTLPLDWMP